MATYIPPTEDLPIFDRDVFITSTDNLTIADADLRYLRFPVAQGTETIASLNTGGVLAITQNGTTGVKILNTQTGSAANPATTGRTDFFNEDTTGAEVNSAMIDYSGIHCSTLNTIPDQASTALSICPNSARSGSINIMGGASATGSVNIATASTAYTSTAGVVIGRAGSGGIIETINSNIAGGVSSNNPSFRVCPNAGKSTITIASSGSASGTIEIANGNSSSQNFTICGGNPYSGTLALASGTSFTGILNLGNAGGGAGTINLGANGGSGLIQIGSVGRSIDFRGATISMFPATFQITGTNFSVGSGTTTLFNGGGITLGTNSSTSLLTIAQNTAGLVAGNLGFTTRATISTFTFPSTPGNTFYQMATIVAPAYQVSLISVSCSWRSNETTAAQKFGAGVYDISSNSIDNTTATIGAGFQFWQEVDTQNNALLQAVETLSGVYVNTTASAVNLYVYASFNQVWGTTAPTFFGSTSITKIG